MKGIQYFQSSVSKLLFGSACAYVFESSKLIKA